MLKKTTYLISFLLLVFVFTNIISFLAKSEFVDASIFYRSEKGITTEVDRFAVCRVVNNTGSMSLFVPANTQAEWCSFVNSLPAGTSVSACTRSVTTYSRVPSGLCSCSNCGSRYWTTVSQTVTYDHNFSNCPR